MMTAYSNRYGFGTALLELDGGDAELAAFARAYRFEPGRGGKPVCGYSIAKRAEGCTVETLDGKCETFSTCAAAFGFVDGGLDRRMRAIASDSLLSLHASSAVVGGGAMLFLGLSGCGKTTLGIETAKRAEGTLGDEYALLDPMSGSVRFEPYPFQVKRPDAPGVCMAYPNGTRSRACRPEDLGVELQDGARSLKAVVLPCRVRGLRDAECSQVPALELHKRVMPSVLGGADRAATYRALTGALSSHGAPVLELRYGEASDAAARLLEILG